MIAVPMFLAFALQHYLAYRLVPAMAILVAAAAASACAVPLLRNTGSVVVVGRAFALVVYLALFALGLARGGFQLSVQMWNLIIPLGSIVLGRAGAALVWIGLIFVQFSVLLACEHLGIVRAPNLPGDALGQAVSMAALLSALALITVFYQRGRERVERERNQAERERIRAEDELRCSEERLRAILGNSRDMITIIDPEGGIVFEGPSAEEVLGYSKDDIRGAHASDFLHPDDLNRVMEAIGKVARNPGIRMRIEVRCRHKDGSWRTIDATGQNLLDVPGVRGILINSCDVTETKQTEAALREGEARARQVQKMEVLGRLAGGVAHDFNNLLAPILGNVGLIQAELPEESALHPLLRDVEKAAERAADLTRQLLAYAGRGGIERQRVDLSELVREMARLLAAAIPRNIELYYELGEEPVVVEGDATQLRQVIMNLLTNASDAMGTRIGTVTLRTGLVHVSPGDLVGMELVGDLAPGTYAYLDVVDTGCGMTEETKAHVFDPFFSTKGQGRGLGLSALLGVVRGHRGAVELVSAPGQGTRFRILLPPSTGQAEDAPSRSTTRAAWRGSGTVLVVDDDESVRRMATRILEDRGFEVLNAENGRQAVELFQEHADELVAILLDRTMPKLGGDEALRRMRRIRPNAKVILSSGIAGEGSRDDAEGDPRLRFIQKPYRAERLVELLRELLDGPF